MSIIKSQHKGQRARDTWKADVTLPVDLAEALQRWVESEKDSVSDQVLKETINKYQYDLQNKNIEIHELRSNLHIQSEQFKKLSGNFDLVLSIGACISGGWLLTILSWYFDRPDIGRVSAIASLIVVGLLAIIFRSPKG